MLIPITSSFSLPLWPKDRWILENDNGFLLMSSGARSNCSSCTIVISLLQQINIIFAIWFAAVNLVD